MKLKGWEARRIAITIGFLGVVAAAIIVRYGVVMLTPAKEYAAKEIGFPTLVRGPILDRRGRLLAQQTNLWSVTAWLPDLRERKTTAKLLSEILNLDERELFAKFTKPNQSSFLYVQRKITPTETQKIRKALAENKLAGIFLQPDRGRNYPERQLAAHLLGYVGLDNTGLAGVEYSFNDQLAPPYIGQTGEKRRGNSVFLTIDIDAQYLIEKVAREALEKEKADSVTVLVMEAQTGEFLAYVSLPSFDPNDFQLATAEERNNRPVTQTYEPGSVFKVFSMASMLALGGVTPESEFVTNGIYNPPLFQSHGVPPITDLGARRTRVMRPVDILIFSSNSGISYAAETISAKALYKMLHQFGFGKPTGIPLSGETGGLLMPLAEWNYRTKPTVAFGQGIGISAVQIITASTVFTNGGTLLKPRIVRKVVSPSGQIVKEYKRAPHRRVISKEEAEDVLLMMEKGVTAPGGVVRRIHIPGLRISAKSGTAETFDKETGTYSKERYIASVLAIVPTNAPRLIVYVMVDHPQGSSIFGGRVSAPLAKKVLRELSTLYEIPSAENQVVYLSQPPSLPTRLPPLEDGPFLPDFQGRPKREVIAYLERRKIPYRAEGMGWIVFQFPPPGAPLEEVESIYLKFQ